MGTIQTILSVKQLPAKLPELKRDVRIKRSVSVRRQALDPHRSQIPKAPKKRKNLNPRRKARENRLDKSGKVMTLKRRHRPQNASVADSPRPRTLWLRRTEVLCRKRSRKYLNQSKLWRFRTRTQKTSRRMRAMMSHLLD